jgi:hypothetical protein
MMLVLAQAAPVGTFDSTCPSLKACEEINRIAGWRPCVLRGLAARRASG